MGFSRSDRIKFYFAALPIRLQDRDIIAYLLEFPPADLFAHTKPIALAISTSPDQCASRLRARANNADKLQLLERIRRYYWSRFDDRSRGYHFWRRAINRAPASKEDRAAAGLRKFGG